MDGRFYLMSLASTFLALALGILVGVHLPGAEALLVSEEMLVTGIEEELASLNSERMDLRRTVAEIQDEKEQLQRDLELIFAETAGGTLKDTRVCISEQLHKREDDTKYLDDLEKILLLAGAEVTTASNCQKEVDCFVSHSEDQPTNLHQQEIAIIEVKNAEIIVLGPSGSREFGIEIRGNYSQWLRFVKKLRDVLMYHQTSD